MKYNDLLNEMLNLLDQNSDIKTVKFLKKKLLADKDLQNNLSLYQEQRTVAAKKKIFKNKDYVRYLESENNIHLLITEIKSKFNCFHDRKCHHESY